MDVEALKSKLLKGVKDTVAWRKTLRPHPLSTPCSRFLDDIPEWTATDQNQHATSVAQARCEITSREIRLPSDMRLSSTGNILAFSAMGGWKNRVPYLHYQLPSRFYKQLFYQSRLNVGAKGDADRRREKTALRL